MNKKNKPIEFLKWLVKGIGTISGYTKNSPSGRYPGEYTQSLFNDSAELINERKNEYENAKINKKTELQIALEMHEKNIDKSIIANSILISLFSIFCFMCLALYLLVIINGNMNAEYVSTRSTLTATITLIAVSGWIALLLTKWRRECLVFEHYEKIENGYES